MRRCCYLLLTLAGLSLSAPPLVLGQTTERSCQFLLEGLFLGGTKPLFLCARERDDQWIAVVGSSRDPDRSGKKTYNRSWYYGDLSGVPIKDGRMQGQFTLHVTPDLWVPRDHKPYTIEFAVDAALKDDTNWEGTWEIAALNSTDVSTKDFGKSGRLTGVMQEAEPPELPEPVTFECRMQSALVGGNPEYGNRCMILRLGLEDGKLAAASHGLLSQKYESYARKPFPLEGNTVKADRDRLTARVTVPTLTLDMEPCRYVYDIDGRLMGNILVGTYRLQVEIDGKPDAAVQGSFEGSWAEGVSRVEVDDRPWFASVAGFTPPEAGEHPRLLFRRSDVPSLREKAKTPEGQAILKRLRYLLDGKDGEVMTTVFSRATQAYMGGGSKNTVAETPGVYTISHAAGYGLLYWLTGEKKYAEYGRLCFEKALEGVRDRDDRYSFRKPGGPLRAGPTLGWYAVGYSATGISPVDSTPGETDGGTRTTR